MYLTLKGLSRKGSNSSVYEAFIQQSRDQKSRSTSLSFRGQNVGECCKVFIAGFSGAKLTAIQLMQFSHLCPVEDGSC